jgi:hypothetical protein
MASKSALFDQARRTDLPKFVESLGLVLKKQGGSYGSPHCPCCGTSKDINSNRVSVFWAERESIWRWKCFICKKGGTTIDYACAAWSKTAPEATNALVAGNTSNFCMRPVAEKPNITPITGEKANQRLKETLEIILKQGYTAEPASLAYLQSRGISGVIAGEASKREMLRMLPSNPTAAMDWLMQKVGESRLRDAGLWRASAKWPAIAFRPLIFMLPGLSSAEFRLIKMPTGDEPKAIRYGRLEWPWFWRGETKRITVVEGAIDLLSLRQMGEKGSIMAIPGTSAWKKEWFTKCAERHKGSIFRIGLDDGPAGDPTAALFMEILRENGTEACRARPAFGKDWNLMLQHMNQAIQ